MTFWTMLATGPWKMELRTLTMPIRQPLSKIKDMMTTIRPIDQSGIVAYSNMYPPCEIREKVVVTEL
jgi:hypothetical protein